MAVAVNVSIRAVTMSSTSMLPNVRVGDLVIVGRRAVFGPPRDGQLAALGSPDVVAGTELSRVVAGPGQTIRIHRGRLYVDGRLLDEPYAWGSFWREISLANYQIVVNGRPLSHRLANVPPPSAWSAPDRIPAGCYFVLDDNRRHAWDSRDYGFAQDGGRFASGPRAGQPSARLQPALAIAMPAADARNLRPR